MLWKSAAVAAQGNLRMPGSNEVMRDRIIERLDTLGLSRNEASRKAGLSTSYVADLLEGRSKNPHPTRLAMLADVLECDVEYLQGSQRKLRSGGTGEVVPFPTPESRMPLTLKMHTVNMTDPDGFFDMRDDDVVPYVPSQAIEGRAENAYAISVASDLNAPRYFPGEVAIASTRRPITPGCFAVIRKTDDRAAIFKVDGIEADVVRVSTLKGGKIAPVKRDEIKDIHRIVAAFEH